MKHLDAFGRFQSISRWTGLAAAALFALTIAGCGGDDGADGKDGAPGKDADPAVIQSLQDQIDAITKAVNPETCVTCHTGENPVARSGPMHQDYYKEFYQDGVIQVSNMNLSVAGTTATLTFKMTKFGNPFNCTKATGSGSDFAIGSYWAEYDPATKTFPSDLSLAASKSYNAGTNTCTFTKTGLTASQAQKMASNGIVQVYGVDEILETNSEKHMSNGKYPFAGVLKVGNVDYTTAANVTGCENCHTRPFLKHAYIYGTVKDQNGQPTEFYTCKGCHYDERNGGHVDWQILKDNPARYAEIQTDPTKPITAAEQTKYAYKAKLMNDVHMSHAMEFAYPQSMKNCITCHADKNDPTKVNAAVLSDDKFKVETCKSCHAVDSLIAKLPGAGGNVNHQTFTLNSTDCGSCHKLNGTPFQAPRFVEIHNGGYDPKIYSSTGVRYSDTFKVTIDEASVDANNMLTVKFSATGSTTTPALSANSIAPTVLVGLYGYNSKDFLVAAHGYDVPDPATRKRLLEFPLTTANPRLTVVKATNPWEVKIDLSMWKDQIAWTTAQQTDRAIRRAEIAVMPELRHPTIKEGTSNMVLGLNAPSKTFNFSSNAFETYFTDIVDVAKGCNTCHDQLATTFHSGVRGGNIKVCRICHEVSNGGSHLELQSRSIDSYVHAVHSFQAFDPKNPATEVEEIEYEHHIKSEFPRFGILNCESCHTGPSAGGSTPGTPNVPNQAKSMPGVLSSTDKDFTERNIAPLPMSVTGPAVRACGACHRAQAINADDPGKLAILTQHWKTFGYSIDVPSNSSDDARALWESVVAKVMGIFKF